MSAPESHWLVVKNIWVPIEKEIDRLVPDVEKAVDKINALRGMISSEVIKSLHDLRKERNNVIHDDLPLADYDKWKYDASEVLKQLRQTSKTNTVRSSPKNEYSTSRTSAASYTSKSSSSNDELHGCLGLVLGFALFPLGAYIGWKLGSGIIDSIFWSIIGFFVGGWFGANIAESTNRSR